MSYQETLVIKLSILLIFVSLCIQISGHLIVLFTHTPQDFIINMGRVTLVAGIFFPFFHLIYQLFLSEFFEEKSWRKWKIRMRRKQPPTGYEIMVARVKRGLSRDDLAKLWSEDGMKVSDVDIYQFESKIKKLPEELYRSAFELVRPSRKKKAKKKDGKSQ